MKLVVVADFGSTFTKVAVIEDGSGCLISSAQHPTTVYSDVMNGYYAALDKALSQVNRKFEIVSELASSSAGGGLRMAAAGIVDDLTTAAGRQAALNAGAKVELVLSGDLDDSHRLRLEQTRPDILLFCGGTDGGQSWKVIQNAEVLARANCLDHVVIACNKEISEVVADRFRTPGRSVKVVENVLPEIDRLHIGPARLVIHETFIENVIIGKGLSASVEFGSLVQMPTPEAVLEAVRLLSFGLDGREESRGVVVIDVGGATTDVYSAMTLKEQPRYISIRGIPDLDVIRSVQGDLGMRWGADSVLLADRVSILQNLSHIGIDGPSLDEAVLMRHRIPEFIALDPRERIIDRTLAKSCITIALKRHSGIMSTVYFPKQGTEFVKKGLDLREAPIVIGTGGVLVHDPKSAELLGCAISRRSEGSLAPRNPKVVIDRQYILAAVGILATRDREAAFRLLDVIRGDIHDTSRNI